MFSLQLEESPNKWGELSTSLYTVRKNLVFADRIDVEMKTIGDMKDFKEYNVPIRCQIRLHEKNSGGISLRTTPFTMKDKNEEFERFSSKMNEMVDGAIESQDATAFYKPYNALIIVIVPLSKSLSTHSFDSFGRKLFAC